MSANEVVHLYDAVFRHLETYRPVRSLLEKPVHLFLRKGEGVAKSHSGLVVIDEGLAAALCLAAKCIQLLRRVEGIVGPAGFD